MAYTSRKKRYCVKQAMARITPLSGICRNRGVPRRTLYRWIERYKRYGWKGLENKKIGRKPEGI
ncbi:helix-turn-helix domain containing protein [Candidatus Woesearchaeota archaeon]|nr:helix-turn-helix domain containing protein [Candidatus Woesearchaeota archaeon]